MAEIRRDQVVEVLLAKHQEEIQTPQLAGKLRGPASGPGAKKPVQPGFSGIWKN
jgi:hypothetical protein